MKTTQLFFIILLFMSPLFANSFNRKKLIPPTYESKSFELKKIFTWLSPEQLNEHETLYKGYVNKRNQITQSLFETNREVADNATYSIFRGLKSSETFAINGMVLHEL